MAVAEEWLSGSWWQPSSFLSFRALPSECQMLLFSATFEDSVWQFAERIIPDPNVIKLRKEELTLNNIRQYYVLCENRKDKYQALCNIYGGITIGQAIIFCQVSLPQTSGGVRQDLKLKLLLLSRFPGCCLILTSHHLYFMWVWGVLFFLVSCHMLICLVLSLRREHAKPHKQDLETYSCTRLASVGMWTERKSFVA